MEIINELKERSSVANSLSEKLYPLASTIATEAAEHLKRISSVLKEYDLHDESHSKKIIYNVEQLLGVDTVKSLSSYELFLLYLSAYLHDCAMAPSDWEIKTLELTEGKDNYKSNINSICNDLKPPFKHSELIKLIGQKKVELQITFDKDCSNWLFIHKQESERIKYLATTLREYQEFRNGYRDKIQALKSQEEFNELNEQIRIDYIRLTHHIRVEIYIKNLSEKFYNDLGRAQWGRSLANDLAVICRAHGEGVDFLNSLNTKQRYFEAEEANLQFVAIMLRLGDVIHFSYDRAPIILRASKIFKSKYSFQQWAIKSDSGINYTIDGGKISFQAYCDKPDTYYSLLEYIKYIDAEIDNYIKFERCWEKEDKKYITNLCSVDIENIRCNKDYFEPTNGQCFSLNQGKIIELLMGVGLYKDKFACLRELYQNSLDTCRCMLSNNESQFLASEGKIEFGINNDSEEQYIYCLDNGIGMNREIIEKFLLNIGNSYYKSPEFYKELSKWDNAFTPTSKFGIGILSCFMIGDRIEITTKKQTGDYVACTINGPHEFIYYHKPEELDKELIGSSGTMVKVYLKDDIAISNSNIDDLGLSLFVTMVDDSGWENHLYKRINDFVMMTPDRIDVYVKTQDKKEKIYNKPFALMPWGSSISVNEAKYTHIDKYINRFNRRDKIISYKELINSFEIYEIREITNDCEFKCLLILPKNDINIDQSSVIHRLLSIGKTGICIDGIYVDNGSYNRGCPYFGFLTHSGSIIFWGNNRPNISVDRTTIIDMPTDSEDVFKELSLLTLKNIIGITKTHLEKYDIKPSDELYHLVWSYVFNKIGQADMLFVYELSSTDFGDIVSDNLSTLISHPVTIKQFLSKGEINIQKYDYNKLKTLEQKLLTHKLLNANSIEVTTTGVSIETDHIKVYNLLESAQLGLECSILIQTDKWEYEYDIISNLYPLVSKWLHDAYSKEYAKIINDRIKLVGNYANHVPGLFKQSPLQIHPQMGLYVEEYKDSDKVFSFDRKRPSIDLQEINEDYRSKNKKVVFAYIASAEYAPVVRAEIERHKIIEPNYYKGAIEGWSVLLTGMETDNVVILPGRCTRDEIVKEIPIDFWEKYKKYSFSFLDGEKMIEE